MHTHFFLYTLLSLLIFNASAQVYDGHATHFEKLGEPYGGCGVPTEFVDSDAFVALNVFNKPNTGPSDFERPIKPADMALMGEFKNGKNCGRWVKVTILEDCVGGPNSGELGKGFCNEPNTSWLDDNYSGAVQYMIVTDACGDNNGWCRDSPYHLDLHTSAVNSFEKNGQPVQDMLPTSFNNRKIAWEYVEAPEYTGDIEIYFMKDSFQWWKSFFITNLKNGIHSVQQKINNSWVDLEMNSDMGQAYIMKESNLPSFTIRVVDASDQLINNGREYTFEFPTACGNKCSNAGTKTSYTTVDPVVTSIQKSDEQEITLYPNPSKNLVLIKNHNNQRWTLRNQYGSEIMNGVSHNFDITALQSGIYYLEINNVRHKLIKIN